MIANGAAEHRILRLQCVEDRSLSNGARHIKLNLAIDLSEVAKMKWQDNSDHGQFGFDFRFPIPDYRLEAGSACGQLFNRQSVIGDYFNVCTSTDNTAGRSRTIGCQLSPESAEQYTCPPVVPK